MSMSVESWSCSAVAERLPAYLDEPGSAPATLLAHVEQCLGCQAELVRGRKMLQMLRCLRAEDLPLPGGLLSDLFVAVEKAGHRRAIRSIVSGRRVAYLSGLGVALISASAIVVVAKMHGSRSQEAGKSPVGPPIA